MEELTKQLDESNKHVQFLSKFANTTLNQNLGKKVTSNHSLKNYSTKIIPETQELTHEIEEAGSSSEDNSGIENKKDKIIENIEMKSKEKDLNCLLKNVECDKDSIIQRLIKGVNMVKEVLQSNLKLRMQNQDFSNEISMLKAEKFHLYQEADELKEKLKIIANMDDELDQNVNLRNSKKLRIANEIIHLKQEKKELEERIKNLEMENINFRANKGNNNNHDFEPVRSILNTADFHKTNYSANGADAHNFQKTHYYLDSREGLNQKLKDLKNFTSFGNEILFHGQLKKMKKPFVTNLNNIENYSKFNIKKGFNFQKDQMANIQMKMKGRHLKKSTTLKKQNIRTSDKEKRNSHFFNVDFTEKNHTINICNFKKLSLLQTISSVHNSNTQNYINKKERS